MSDEWWVMKMQSDVIVDWRQTSGNPKAKLLVELLEENEFKSSGGRLPFFLSFSCKDDKVPTMAISWPMSNHLTWPRIETKAR